MWSTTQRRNDSTRGFTLLELLLVIALLGVLVGVVFPRLRGSVRAAGLVEGTQKVADTVRFARAEAMRRGLGVRFEVDTGQQSYRIFVQQADDDAGASFAEFGDSYLDKIRFLPQGIRFGKIRAGDQALPKPALVFMPNGIMEPHTIELVNTENRKAFVDIGPWLDEVKPRFSEEQSSEHHGN